MAKLPFAGQLQFAQYIGLLVGNRLVFGVERYLSPQHLVQNSPFSGRQYLQYQTAYEQSLRRYS